MSQPSLRYASVCSGIESAHFALSPLGFVADWFSEIAPFPCAVLQQRLPAIPNHGDMCGLADKINSNQIAAPDLLCAGTPCQSFSMLGQRAGISDQRGNLTLELVNILNAIDKQRIRQGQRPAVLLWENVRGILSSKDNAFGQFLAALAGMCEPFCSPHGKGKSWPGAGCIIGGQRRIAWRILNAQYFGIPQSRPRLFLVASAATAGIDPGAVLFESKSSTGIITAQQPGNQQRKNKKQKPFNLAFHSGINARRWDKHGNRLISLCLLGGSNDNSLIGCNMIIAENGLPRKLIPIERERLQGLPDNWTQIAWRGKAAEQCPDGPRVTAIGNAWPVPVIHWIGERLVREMG